jgi:hypothetical protein
VASLADALWGAALLQAIIRRGIVGTDPETLAVLTDLISFVEGCEMPTELPEVDRLTAEVERLKRGDLTPDEFQGLCHNLTEKQLARHCLRLMAERDRSRKLNEHNAEMKERLYARVAELEAALRRILFWRHYDGAPVDGFRLREELDAAAALLATASAVATSGDGAAEIPPANPDAA